MTNEHAKSNRHTRKARHQPSPDRAARHADTLASQPVVEYDVKRNFTRFIGRFRQMTGKDKDELKNVVERLKMVNTH